MAMKAWKAMGRPPERPSRIAIPSTRLRGGRSRGSGSDGNQPDWLGYLWFCSDFGIGRSDLGGIEIGGEKLAAVSRKYMLHRALSKSWMDGTDDGRTV